MRSIFILLIWVLSLTLAYNVNLINNGYEGVLVGISPTLDESQAENILRSIKKTIITASDVLFKATRKRAYFKNVKILIPTSWTNTAIDETALNEHFEDSNIRIDRPNIIYGSQPYTLQPGTCGQPGGYIHLTPEYLIESIQEELWGPRSKTLVHEWAKFRWGVFDEIGYPGDRIFPLFYWTKQFTMNGVEEVFTLNTCNNTELNGELIDVVTNKSCSFTSEGLPDDNCRFVPGDNQTTTSSLMSYHHIKSVDEFCDTEANEKHSHNKVAPNKHNIMCKERSVWDIMMMHKDFANGTNPPINEPKTPNIKVIRQTEAKFVLVLDYSRSMDNFQRQYKLQRTAKRWIHHEVSQGSFVGIIKFWENASLVANLTEITDMASRKTLASLIDLQTNQSSLTSIGSGLSMAMHQIVNQTNSVIILVTASEENKEPCINDVLPTVVKSGVRVVTIAFGNDADSKLESLAEQTGGKMFSVVDEDVGGMLDDAFQSSLIYQPGETLTNTKINIYKYEHRGSNAIITKSFPVDSSVGRNLQFRLDTNDENHNRLAPILIRPNGTIIGLISSFDPIIKMCIIDVDLAEEGMWKWSVALSGYKTNYIRVSVTAMARDPEELPIHTTYWLYHGTKSFGGHPDPVVFYAQVQQGNNPVVGAKVRAYVTQPNSSADAIEIDLRDDGVETDNIANDGVYSRYILTTMTGRFSVKVQVWDDGSSYISGGNRTSHEKKKLSTPIKQHFKSGAECSSCPFIPPPPQDYCCGSKMPFDPETSTPTGPFTRIMACGSFKVEIEPPDGDYLSPGRVTDLEVVVISKEQLMITWTAPGDDLDQGIVSAYEIQLSPNRSHLEDKIFRSNNNNTVLLSFEESKNITDLFVDAGNKVVFNVTVSNGEYDKSYYVGLQARDETHHVSEVSNRASLHVKTEWFELEVNGLEGWEIALIVLGSVLIIAIAVVIVKLCME